MRMVVLLPSLRCGSFMNIYEGAEIVDMTQGTLIVQAIHSILNCKRFTHALEDDFLTAHGEILSSPSWWIKKLKKTRLRPILGSYMESIPRRIGVCEMSTMAEIFRSGLYTSTKSIPSLETEIYSTI